MAPAKTPQPIIDKIHGQTVKALHSKDIRETLAKSRTDVLGNTPREANVFLKIEVARRGKVIKQANVNE